MSERALELLKRVNPADLEVAVGVANVRTMEKLEAAARDSLPLLSQSYCGTDLLGTHRLRRALLETLPAQVLQKMAWDLCGNEYGDVASNAQALATLPWKAGGSASKAIVRALGLPSEYLPPPTGKNPPYELLDPLAALPQLLPHQKDVKEECLAKLMKLGSRLLIQMPTGSGKTRTAMEVLVEYAQQTELFTRGRSVVWLAHTEELCEQAIESFRRVWLAKGNTPVGIARLWGSYKQNINDLAGSLIVTGLQKLYSLVKSGKDAASALKDVAELVVVDEAHKALAPTFRQAIESLMESGETSLIGLSATPGRGADKVMENRALARMFNSTLVRPKLGTNPIASLREQGILSRLSHVFLDSPASIRGRPAGAHGESQTDIPSKVLNRLAVHKVRNSLILECIQQEVSSDCPCIVFCCTTNHARVLSATLGLRGVRAEAVDSSMRRSIRRRRVQAFRSGGLDVLLNFGVLSTGFDSPRTRTVLITRPTTSLVLYAQMIGRALRGPAMGGAADATLVDVRDNESEYGDVSSVYDFFEGYWA